MRETKGAASGSRTCRSAGPDRHDARAGSTYRRSLGTDQVVERVPVGVGVGGQPGYVRSGLPPVGTDGAGRQLAPVKVPAQRGEEPGGCRRGVAGAFSVQASAYGAPRQRAYYVGSGGHRSRAPAPVRRQPRPVEPEAGAKRTGGLSRRQQAGATAAGLLALPGETGVQPAT
jgi:hypothetical protein